MTTKRPPSPAASALDLTSATGAAALDAVLARPQETLIGLDFDGTLSPIGPDPEQAFAHPGAVEAMARLGRLIGTVAVITGRPARTAVRLGGFSGRAGLESMVVLGQYGVERWNAAGDDYQIPPDPPEIAELAQEIPGLLVELDLRHARIENKGRAIGVHTRELADGKAAFQRLSGPLRELAERHGLHLEPGKQVLEIRLPGMDKGTALRDLVAERGARQVIFAGDDLGDVPAFVAVEQLRSEGVPGLLISSASSEEDALASRADLELDGPDKVAEWLGRLADRLEGSD